jgi:predicted nuclease of predicted toxin-antitoxin system
LKFKVDQNLPVEVADLLTAAGHEAATVEAEGLGGADDAVLASHVQAEGRALVTLDLDFGDIRTYPPQDYAGIVVLRSRVQDKATILHLVGRFILLLATEPLVGHLWIVEIDRVRIHPGTNP